MVCEPDGRAGNRIPGRSPGEDSGGRAPEAETGSARCGLDSEAAGRNRVPAIWLPSKELRDLRALLWHRHQWVRMRTRVQNALQAIALANGLRRGPSLWSQAGQHAIASLPLAPHTAYRRTELQALYVTFAAEIEKLNQRVAQQAWERPGALLLMTHPGVGPVTALATEVFLGDPTRFADGKALASYVGIIPREYSSGGRQKPGGLNV